MSNTDEVDKFCKDCAHCIPAKKVMGIEIVPPVCGRIKNPVNGEPQFLCSSARRGILSHECGIRGILWEQNG